MRARPTLRIAAALFAGAGALLLAVVLLAQAEPAGIGAARTPRTLPPRDALGQTGVTFNKEIARIFQTSCQKCHRDGGIGPYALVTYADAYAHKNEILVLTTQRKMPPWHVSSSCAAFEDDPSLSAADLDTITKWVQSGAPEGDPKDLPAPVTFPSDWSLGTPDLVLSMPESFKPNIGYVLAQPYWGQGLMTEAARAVVEFAFADPRVFRVWAVCDVDNARSARVLEKVGMTREGVLRRWTVHPNISPDPRDVLCYSRVRT